MTHSFSRRDLLKGGLAASAAVLLNQVPTFGQPRGKNNVLFIAVDDLRPQLGCYGHKEVHSPNIDALAARGTTFNRAYCQQAVCSPSRTCVMTGRRPDTTKVYDLQTHFRLNLPNVVTLAEHFKKNGYHAQGLSKIYHPGLNDPQSWTVPLWLPGLPSYGKKESLDAIEKRRKELQAEGRVMGQRVQQRDPKTGLALKVRPGISIKGPAWEDPDVADNVLPDGATADKAIQTLRELKNKQFFLGVGFLKPHLPFVAPRKYFDLYDPKSLKLADNPLPPLDAPDLALTNWGELRQYTDIPKEGPLSTDQARDLVHAYHASVSYTDAQIGRVVAELDRLGLRDNTVIVLWGDHGWHLGEHGLWCKHTNFEVATRAPLIISAPGQKNPGSRSDALVEFVDIYPTVSALCGLGEGDGVEGTSLIPVMDDPGREWKKAAFSQYPRGEVMGYSMRTERYRYTEWRDAEGKAVAVELYDHATDPEENRNLSGAADRKTVVDAMREMLRSGAMGAMPVLRH